MCHVSGSIDEDTVTVTVHCSPRLPVDGSPGAALPGRICSSTDSFHLTSPCRAVPSRTRKHMVSSDGKDPGGSCRNPSPASLGACPLSRSSFPVAPGARGQDKWSRPPDAARRRPMRGGRVCENGLTSGPAHLIMMEAVGFPKRDAMIPLDSSDGQSPESRSALSLLFF